MKNSVFVLTFINPKIEFTLATCASVMQERKLSMGSSRYLYESLFHDVTCAQSPSFGAQETA